MSWLSRNAARYAELVTWEAPWSRLCQTYGGRQWVVGMSVQKRPLRVYEFGDPSGPTVLLSALIHGIELIGGLALLDTVKTLLASGNAPRLVVMPVVNPDAVAHNLDRLQCGRWAGQRKNARGVDLNRNFAWVTEKIPRHPFAGSRWKRSPHYIGPEPFSEPETRAVRDVAETCRPQMSIGFHSFGNLLLYPWAHTDRPHPRKPEYQDLAQRFQQALHQDHYDAKPASSFYPTIGDLDDWLDHRFGTYAFTVEVSNLCRRLLSLRRFFNPFFWMNPHKTEGVLSNVVPAVHNLVRTAM